MLHFHVFFLFDFSFFKLFIVDKDFHLPQAAYKTIYTVYNTMLLKHINGACQQQLMQLYTDKATHIISIITGNQRTHGV